MQTYDFRLKFYAANIAMYLDEYLTKLLLSAKKWSQKIPPPYKP